MALGRNKLPDLVNKTFDDYHVNVLGFDVVFAEEDESSGLKNLEEIKTKYLANDQALGQALEKLRPSLDCDQVFANSLTGHKVVLGYFFSRDESPIISGVLPAASFVEGSFNNKNIQIIEANGYGANLDFLQKNAMAEGILIQTLTKMGFPAKCLC